MKRMMRWLLTGLLLLLFSVTANAEGTTVNSMDAACTVDRYGVCTVSATAEISFAEAQQEVRLPLGANVRKISVQGADFTTEETEGNTWIVLKNSAGTVGDKTYSFSYQKTKTVTVGSDKNQTLELELLCPLWEYGVQKLTFSVTLPKEFTAQPTFRSGYYGDAIAVESSIDGQTIQGSVTNALLDRESVQMNLVLPAGYFRVLHVVGGTAAADLILMLLLGAVGAAYWALTLRNPLPRRQQRRFSPDGVSAWEFPYVLSCGKPDLSLLVSEWATMGYLAVEITRRGRIYLTARIPMSNERRSGECRIFEALFRRGDTCRGDTARFRRIGDKAAANARRYWNRRLFARSSGSVRLLQGMAALAFGLAWMRAMDQLVPAWTLRALLLIPALILGFFAGLSLQKTMQILARKGQEPLWPGFLSLFGTAALSQFGGSWPVSLLGLLLLALSAAGTYRGGRRSPAGLELIEQANAFRRYLQHSDTHHLQLMLHQDSQYFYDVLPYAEALGMGRRFAKAFANIQMEPCAWLFTDRQYQTALEFYAIYRDAVRSMQGDYGKAGK